MTESRIMALRSVAREKIKGIEVYQGGTVKVVRGDADNPVPVPVGGKRKEIRVWSWKSRIRLLIVSRETQVKFKSLITLTYGRDYPIDGREVKRHLNTFLTWYRREVSSDYIWWFEFQKRGAPHIHIACGPNVPDGRARHRAGRAWVNAIGLKKCLKYSDIGTKKEHCMSEQVYSVNSHADAWQNVRVGDGALRYIAKYALKTRQKTVPDHIRNVGRWWGASRTVMQSIPEPVFVGLSAMDAKYIASKGGSVVSPVMLPKYILGYNGPELADMLDEVIGVSPVK